MNKNLFIALMAISVGAFAQPTLQTTNFMPIGFSCDVSFGAATTPGSAGANQTWDLSSVSATPAGTVAIVGPGATSCSSTFSGANWAETIPSSPIQYNYYNRTATQMQALGESVPSNSCTAGQDYTADSKIVLKFPFTYNSTYTDTYIDNGSAGSVSVTCDGYGTLITPTGTVTNVIRVVTVDGSSTNYNWYTTGNPSYVVAIIQSGSTLFFSNPMVGIKEVHGNFNPQLYPNPASTALTVKPVHAGNEDLFIYDIKGGLLLTKKISGEETIDVSQLQNGVYTVVLTSGNETGRQKLVIAK